ncbi:prolipoprotein diacylglyceryl transferase [Parvibaculum sedimenti]|uniref:Phosphatidylglycerol--prolipoprotein diacylglyceryl transferase n=1 Tax=Parvibaculum sedimenti TaxID=2608632 RepID=A0A6N6VFI0_9HYPH|nr:prolipoprotein diacylglyceryl transferase [Parvibaculum sedimenti]KAB7739440.1 prolipoprotein diacylglyceryl transferase [Parvibaculum sedimenti]
MTGIPFPNIDPVLIHIGPLAIRWYALAYIAGLVLGWRYILVMIDTPKLWRGSAPISKLEVDDALLWAALGVILGGRIGYVFVYNFSYYMEHPNEIFTVWHGGMSFHGGALGVLVALLIFSRRRNIPALTLMDLVCAAQPIGQFFGRIANFINGELWGRPTDVPWAMVFPTGGPIPRHPSQLYEAALEGIVLFIILRLLTHRYGALKRPGTVMGIFIMGYGVSRVIVEFFREPDAQVGYLYGDWLTMGMLLSVPMILAGALLAWKAPVVAEWLAPQRSATKRT